MREDRVIGSKTGGEPDFHPSARNTGAPGDPDLRGELEPIAGVGARRRNPERKARRTSAVQQIGVLRFAQDFGRRLYPSQSSGSRLLSASSLERSDSLLGTPAARPTSAPSRLNQEQWNHRRSQNHWRFGAQRQKLWAKRVRWRPELQRAVLEFQAVDLQLKVGVDVIRVRRHHVSPV